MYLYFQPAAEKITVKKPLVLHDDDQTIMLLPITTYDRAYYEIISKIEALYFSTYKLQ